MARGSRVPVTAKKPTPTPEEPEAPSAQSYQKNRARMAKLKEPAQDFKNWRPAAQVLRLVEAVPTRFPDYDIAVKVGGHPISRVTVVHGPSANGKTEFCLGLGESFLRRGHYFGLLDLERTTPLDWVQGLYGEMAASPRFLSMQPDNTYEQARAAVREFCTTIAELRAKGRVAPDTTGILLVDSVKKLIPKDLLKQLQTELKAADEADGAGGKPRGRHGKKPQRHIDGAGGRAGQIKAAYNAVWMDELVPLLADTRCALVMIARETKDEAASSFYEDAVKVGGGVALVYESSLLLQVSAQGIWVPRSDDPNRKHQVGEKHTVGIRKSKVAGKLEPVVDSIFHTSNGIDAPSGFWWERDVLHVGLQMGCIELKGANYYFDGKRIGLGAEGTLKRLMEDRPVALAIEQAARAAAKPGDEAQSP